jgi:hypothetical protein
MFGPSLLSRTLNMRTRIQTGRSKQYRVVRKEEGEHIATCERLGWNPRANVENAVERIVVYIGSNELLMQAVDR